MRPVYLIVSLLLTGGSLVAQQRINSPNPDSSDRFVRERAWVVKVAPLSLFDPDNTIQFGVERWLGGRHALQAEFGYGWQSINLWQNSQNQRYSDREVWRGRAEYRYYYHPTSRLGGSYFAVEGFYKQVNALESGTYGVGCQSGPCQYYRIFREPVQKYVWGMHAKTGRQFALTPDDRWLMDIYVGLGFRKSEINRYERPSSSAYFYESAGYSLFDAFSPRPYPVVSLAYGFKIGYAL